VLEAEEPFDPGQKGSSAMPHKRNPILTENLTGLARLVRSAVSGAGERAPVARARHQPLLGRARHRPDTSVHLDFALRRLAGVVERLVIYPENMAKNLDRLGGLVHSQRVLLGLTQKGLSREASYAAVQRNAMKVWRGEGNFLDFLKADPEITLADAELEALFDLDYHFKNVDRIFARVFGEHEEAKASRP
jgi:adenylosuccinate lyase